MGTLLVLGLLRVLRDDAKQKIMGTMPLVLRRILGCLSVFFLLTSMVAPVALSDGLPRTFGWTAYGTTSGGYAVSVAIGNALADDGYRLRVIPAKNDISRLTPLRAGRVHFSATGIGS